MTGIFRSKWVQALAYVPLVFWGGWWAVSWTQNRLVGAQHTSVPAWKWMGCDFDINYCATREWAHGSNPYQGYTKFFGVLKYDHPPLVLRLFSWCNLLPRQAALLVWLIALAGIATLGAVQCWRSRKELGLTQVALPVVLAAVLFSYPVLFEMERGNWNMLVLLAIVLAVAALKKGTAFGDTVAGGLIGVAACIKMYPALLFFGLVSLRRWRAAATCAVVGLVIGLADIPGDFQFAQNIRESASRDTPDQWKQFFATTHTLGGSWKVLCADLHLGKLGQLPGTAGWALLILPLVVRVSYGVSRAANAAPLFFPYLVWLTAAASFLPAIANDYSLFFVPLAALAVWDRKDPWPIHLLMLPVLLWWQPLALPVSARFLWYSKLLALAVVATSLQRRAREQLQLVQPADAGHVTRLPLKAAA